MHNQHDLNQATGMGLSIDQQHVLDSKFGQVHIKVDAGLSRNGCQLEELAGLMQVLNEQTCSLQLSDSVCLWTCCI